MRQPYRWDKNARLTPRRLFARLELKPNPWRGQQPLRHGAGSGPLRASRGYTKGCRCDECYRAQRDYQKAYHRRRRERTL